MNFVADESVDGPTVARLRQDGHRVTYIAEVMPGSADTDVLERAEVEQAVLLTEDLDFGELVMRQRRRVPGVVLIRLPALPPARKAPLVSRVIAEHQARLVDAFAVIMPGRVRVHGLRR